MRLAVILIFIFTAFCATPRPLFAQSNPCSLRAEQLPEIRGLKLGMTVAQIKKRYPFFKPPQADQFGYAEFEYDFTLERGRYESYGSEDKEPLEGIDKNNLAYIGLGFLDNTLTSLAVSYDSSANWNNIGEFQEFMIKSLKLPEAAKWTAIDRFTQQFDCTDYLIRATIRPRHGASGIGFFKFGVAEEIKKREAADKERKRREFKP